MSADDPECPPRVLNKKKSHLRAAIVLWAPASFTITETDSSSGEMDWDNKMTQAIKKTSAHAQSQVGEACLRALTEDNCLATERDGAHVVSFLHRLNLDADTYARMLKARGAKLAQETAYDFIEQHIEQLQPRDAVERMLAVQLLWQHIRISTLCIRESSTTNPKEAAALRSSIDQAMNTFRRQAQAMRDLQAPRSLNLIHGGQVNVGDGQIVTNTQIQAKDHCANELGSEDVDQTEVSADARGSSEASVVSTANPAMDALDRAKDGRRKTCIESERPEAWTPRLRGARI